MLRDVIIQVHKVDGVIKIMKKDYVTNTHKVNKKLRRTTNEEMKLDNKHIRKRKASLRDLYKIKTEGTSNRGNCCAQATSDIQQCYGGPMGGPQPLGSTCSCPNHCICHSVPISSQYQICVGAPMPTMGGYFSSCCGPHKQSPHPSGVGGGM